MLLLNEINKLKNDFIKSKHFSCLRKFIDMNKIYRLLFALLCLVGCSFQVYNISQIYFSFETTTHVKYENVVNISLPAITICIDKKYLLRKQFFPQFIGLENENSNRDEFYAKILQFINNFTAAQQLDILYGAQEVFGNECRVITPIGFDNNGTGDYIPCQDIQPIRRSIDFYESCFTIFDEFYQNMDNQSEEELNKKFSINFDVSIQNYWLEIMNLKVLLNIKSFKLFLHSRKQRIRDSFDYNMITIWKKLGEKSCIKYHLTEVNLMPEPYSTKCFEFDGKGHRSRLDCIFNCKIETLRKKYKKWPGNYLMDESEANNDTMINMIEELSDNTSLDLQVMQI